MPEPAGLRRLTDDTVIEAGPGHPVRWAPLGATDTAGTVCAAKGHEAVIAASPRELARVLDPLLSGKRVLVGDLLSGFRPSRTAVPEDTIRDLAWVSPASAGEGNASSARRREAPEFAAL
ncbi:hypothetical protein ACNPQM_41050, partial [Streptomyces sp. NPDC056231]